MRPRPMNLQSDNQAVVANGNRPKGKVRMVTPMLKARIKMVAAGLIPKVTYVPKEYMDIETRIDEFGRIQYTQDDLGLMQKVLMPALAALDPNWSSRNWIDALACRATHQPWCQEWIGRWPNHDALPQPDFLSYNLLTHPDLNSKALFLHPPTPLIAKILQRIMDQPRDALMLVPLMVEKPSWWSLLLIATKSYAVIQIAETDWIHPGGRAHTKEARTDRCSRILCSLSAKRCLDGQDPTKLSQLSKPTLKAVLPTQSTLSNSPYPFPLLLR